MAMLNPNTVIGLLRGKLGELVFVPATEGTVIVKHRPSRQAPYTGAKSVYHVLLI